MISKGVKITGFVAGSALSWLGSYYFLSDYVLRSSSLVKQTLFNLETIDEVKEKLGGNIQVQSRINGPMNQFRGSANLSFTCQGTLGIHI